MREGEAVQVINLDRTKGASFHLVRVRTEERRHFHRKHDVTVALLEGKGTLYLRGEQIPMTVGTIVTVKREAVHYYVNEAKHPSVFYVIFTPPMDGRDRVLVRAVKDFLN